MQQLQFLVYELLSNAMQHAKADQIMVHAQYADAAGTGSAPQLVLTISDNGQGLPVNFNWSDPQRAGLGLRGLATRAQALGASWQVLPPEKAKARGCALQGMAVQLMWVNL